MLKRSWVRIMSAIPEKAIVATKWSFITEAGVKLISPLVNIALAHVLLPDAFGVVASITMIVSFSEMLSDAGFQKYLIQKHFCNDCEKSQYASVAFWTNLCLSLFFAC